MEVRASDMTTGLTTNRWTGPTTQTNSWTCRTASASATACTDRGRRPRCCWWPGGIKTSLRGRHASSTPWSSAGFRVIRHDNRDAGRSSRIQTPPPGTLRQFRARPRPDAYNLQDMADDAVALLDHLGLERVHVARHVDGRHDRPDRSPPAHPERVHTLTSSSPPPVDRRSGSRPGPRCSASPGGRPHPRGVGAPAPGPAAHLAGLDLPAGRGRRDPVRRGRLGPAAAVRGPAGAAGRPADQRDPGLRRPHRSSCAGSPRLPSSSTATAT